MNDHPVEAPGDFLMSERGFLLIAQAMHIASKVLRGRGEQSNSEDMHWLLAAQKPPYLEPAPEGVPGVR